MKILSLIFAMLLPALASAGAYEDLEESVIRGNSTDAIALINRGVDINTVDKAGNSLITQAVVRDMPELVDFLIKRRARLNVRNRNGETALSMAAFTGQMNYVQRLVEAGAEVDFYGWAPLLYAAYNGHTAIVEYLLKRGADINAKTENGLTALFFAARFGHIEIIKVLLKNEADPTVVSENMETAVDWALKSENTDIADLLRAAGGRSGKSLVIDLSK